MFIFIIILMLFSASVLSSPEPTDISPPQFKSQADSNKKITVNSGNVSDCGLNEKAQQLALLIIQDPEQQRATLSCHPLLAQAAADKAKAMAKGGKVNHYIGGLGANERLRMLGYQLPPFYSGTIGNQVEAVAGGYSTAEEAWRVFKTSAGHRSHLLGELPFYLQQNHIGVGFYYEWSSPHVEYWAVYVAREAAPEDPVVTCYDIGCIN
ncbi:CAP domain-containing protein [Arsukibacterium sp.]|uniref:CAP domain-containing protein n=1 Tax=Arsukibacterium sp. TaxID=1977258 RepID=UPI00299E6762|nr:CAP domain-containing protein [Arsukibacterium sp.]MDX1539497.1 CAP domain-containing protein [Arsukibacterium sp.]